MSSGLLALLDDVVALTKLAAATLDDAAGQAAKASAKAAGVVIDDAAVTPRYVVGLASSRELPIVGQIAWGSLKNKILYLLPAGLLIASLAPWLMTPILMVGALYLCFEGYEKLHEMLSGHGNHDGPAADDSQTLPLTDATSVEDSKIAGAIRTDLVLSAEIMAISLASIDEPNFFIKSLVLATVAVFVTAGVYGAVALIVKADDLGLYLAQKDGPISRPVGRALVFGMPPFLRVLAVIGTAAMLWVGGGILVHGLAEFGVSQPEHALHEISEILKGFSPGAAGSVMAWLATAAGSALIGIIAGGLTALLVSGVAKPAYRLLHR